MSSSDVKCLRALAVLGLCIAGFVYLLFGHFSSGEKVGTIVKVSREGVIFKTYEAELIRGGINNGSGVWGQPFYFTIKDKNILQIASDALNQQKEVRVNYHSDFIAPISSGNRASNFADSVQVLN